LIAFTSGVTVGTWGPRPRVERAFVHVDYVSRCYPEHMLERWGASGSKSQIMWSRVRLGVSIHQLTN